MVKDAQGRIKFVGPGGKITWVSEKTFKNPDTRQTLSDMGFSVFKEEKSTPVSLPPIDVEQKPKRAKARAKHAENGDRPTKGA